MRATLIVLACCVLTVPPRVLAEDPSKAVTVRKIDLPGFRGEANGNVKKPVVITSVEELAKTFPDRDLNEKLKKQVDFGKEQLLFFAWSGSGGDKLTVTTNADKKPPVQFHYQAGFTDDLRRHVHLYALPRSIKWEIADVKGE